MINKELNINEITKFVECNRNNDPIKLRLKRYSSTLPYDIQFAITQVESRQKAAKKIPEILQNPEFLFPSTLLAEQCTDEKIAKFHASLFTDCNSVVDLTAGLCVDSYYISKIANTVTSVEIDSDTAYIDKLNMSPIAPNITVIDSDAKSFLENSNTIYDGIFIDPARRNNQNNRVYGLDDCSPNIFELLPILENRAKFIIIKASPMLDINEILRTIKKISDIWIIGIKNECKEVLIKLDFKPSNTDVVRINTYNILSDNVVQKYSYSITETLDELRFSIPHIGDYLYEPNCCLMKLNASRELQATYNGIYQLHPNTHLFTSSDKIEEFPGRSFLIEDIINFNESKTKNFKKDHPKINISTRNFRLTTNQLKNKLKVKDGGDKYLFGCTLYDGKQVLLLCSKITF